MTTEATHDCRDHPWTLDDLSEPTKPRTNRWGEIESGMVVAENFLDPELVAAFMDEWKRENGFRSVDENGILWADRPGGYADTPYLDHRALFDLVTDGRVGQFIEDIIGEPGSVHLCLSPWRTTARNYHQDHFLNELNSAEDRYIALHFALDEDTAPDAGVFQSFPGSQRWGRTITKALISQCVDISSPDWPKKSEDVLTPIAYAEAAKHGTPEIDYVPKAYTLMGWDPLLWHRGSASPRTDVPDGGSVYRPALIAHYSGQRWDMPPMRQSPRGGWYYPFRPLAFDPTEGV